MFFESRHLRKSQPAHEWDFADFGFEGEVGRASEGPLTVLNRVNSSWHVVFVSAADLKYCNPGKRSKSVAVHEAAK